MSVPCIAAFYGGPLNGQERPLPDTIYWVDEYRLDPAPFDTIYDLWDAQKKDELGLIRTLRYIFKSE
jgi:hypothetical protein